MLRLAAVLMMVTGAVLLLMPAAHGAMTPADTTPPDSSPSGPGHVPKKDLGESRDPSFIYRRDCATCHGADGRGSDKAPSLAHAGRAGVYYWVSTGRMPIENLSEAINRQPPRYPPAVIARLVDYVVGLTGGHGPDIPKLGRGSVAKGGELFSLECSACHAWSGHGSVIDGGDAPSVLPANRLQIASAIRVGPGQMPAFGSAAFDDHELDDVVAFTHQLRHPKDQGGFGLWHRGPVTEGAAGAVFGVGVILLAVGWIGDRARPVRRG